MKLLKLALPSFLQSAGRDGWSYPAILQRRSGAATCHRLSDNSVVRSMYIHDDHQINPILG